jgi:hypothetical protein
MAIGRAFQQLKRELQRGINRDAYAMTRRAALRIVNDLQVKGPYWDGLFYNAWEVQAGDVNIPADQEGLLTPSETAQPKPKAGAFTLSDIPEQRVDYRRVPSLTIGNRMVYRDIALDLEPGRIKGEGGGTAPQDWYLTYYGGGEMDRSIGRAIKDTLSLPGES